MRDETAWHKLAWNFGVAPLLWVTTPEYVRLYNAYQPPEEYEQRAPLLKEFPLGQALDQSLAEINATCSRRHIAMGSFWQSPLASRIDRQHRIDNVLLRELINLLGHFNVLDHQGRLFPFRFDAIPVELITGDRRSFRSGKSEKTA